MKRQKQTDELDYNYCPSCKSLLKFKTFEKKEVLSCTKCTFTFWNNPRPVVSALIIYKNSVLLIKRKGDTYNGYWSLPGGIINYLETPEQALIRETFEETNFRIKNLKLFDVYLIKYSPNGLSEKPAHTSIDIVYRASLINSNVINSAFCNQEISLIKWHPINNLPNLIAFRHRKIINKLKDTK